MDGMRWQAWVGMALVAFTGGAGCNTILGNGQYSLSENSTESDAAPGDATVPPRPDGGAHDAATDATVPDGQGQVGDGGTHPGDSGPTTDGACASLSDI